MIVPIAILKAWRWNYLKKIQGIKYKLLDSFLIYNIGFLIGSITPGKIGEVSKIFYLREKKYSTGKSLVSVIIDRLADAVYLFILGYLGIIFTLSEFRSKINTVYLVIIGSVIFIIIFIRKGWHKAVVKKIFYKLIPQKYQSLWQINSTDFLNDLKKITYKNYLYVLLITALSWLIYYFQIYIFALSVNLQIPIIQLAIAATVSGLITLLPISFLGIGTREAILIILLRAFTSDIAAIIILSQLILLANIAAGLMGAICWKFKPLPLKKLRAT